MAKFGQNDPIESCLVYDEVNGCLVYTTNLGNDKPVKLPSDKVELAWTGECELVVTVNGVECDRQDITPLLEKYNFNYNSDTHTITAGPDGAEVPFVLNCATLELDTSNGCELVYTNEKGVPNRIAIPVVSMTRDAEACTITADDGKGGEFVFYEGANPETDIALELDANKDLCMRYKTKECHVVLGNFVTDIALDQTNCLLKVFKWCDDEPTDIDLFAALGITKNDDGGFDIQLKDQVCTFSPATLTQDADNPLTFYFDNQYGQAETITLPSDTVVDNGETYTFTQTDGTEATVCKNPVKTVNGVAPDETGNVDTPESTLVDNGDNTFTHTTDTGTEVDVFTGSVADNGDGTGTVTDGAGNSCVFLKTVDIPADVFVQNITLQENADGTMHDVILTLNNGTPLNAGPVVDADTFAEVTDNNDGTGTVEDPAGNACTFVKGVQSTVVDNAEGEGGGVGTATMTQNDGSVKDDVVCGAQSTIVDDGDGGATATQNDGTQCKLSTVLPVKWDDSNYAKNDTIKPIDYNTVDVNQFGRFIKWPGYASPGAVAGAADYCVPASPTECPEIPGYTVDQDRCTTYCWDGATWTIGIFAPDNLPVSTTVPNTPIVSADIQALNVAAWNLFDTVVHEYTNTDCVRHFVCFTFTMITDAQFVAGNAWYTNYFPGAGNSFAWRHIPTHRYDTTCVSPSDVNDFCVDRRESQIESCGYVAPGGTVQFVADRYVRPQVLTPNPQNRVDLGASLCIADGRRSAFKQPL